MTDQNDNKNQDDICCEGGDCCAQTSTGGWKTIVFTVIIILAVGVAGYSLFLREPNPAASGCDPATCSPTSCDAATSSNATAGGNAIISGIPQITIGGESIDAVNDLEDLLAEVDLAILLFIYSEDQIPRENFIAIKQAIRLFEKKSVKSRIYKIFYEDPLFRSGLERFGISRLPAIVLQSEFGSQVLSVDNLTTDNILYIYDKISVPSNESDKMTKESSET